MENENYDYNDYEQNREYDEKKKKMILVLLFIFIAVLLLSLGLYLSLFNKKDTTKGNVDYNDLLVIHSKSEYGDTINSFDAYSSKENAYSYTFYIENMNNTDVAYTIYLVDYSNNQNINKSNINYSIIKNNDPIYTGTLENSTNIKLVANKVMANSKDNYEIKMWSKGNINDFKFKIKVGE